MENNEMRDLGTHAAGATNLHETRHTDRSVTIEAPVVTTSGIYDPRTGDRDADANVDAAESQ